MVINWTEIMNCVDEIKKFKNVWLWLKKSDGSFFKNKIDLKWVRQTKKSGKEKVVFISSLRNWCNCILHED